MVLRNSLKTGYCVLLLRKGMFYGDDSRSAKQRMEFMGIRAFQMVRGGIFCQGVQGIGCLSAFDMAVTGGKLLCRNHIQIVLSIIILKAYRMAKGVAIPSKDGVVSYGGERYCIENNK